MSVNKDNSPVGENCNAILCKDEEQEEWEDLGYGTDLTFGTLNVVETPHTEDDAESGTVCGILVEPCGEFGNQISAPELRDDVDLSMEKNEAISSDDGHIFVEDCGIECVWEKEPESIESVMSMKSWIACEGLRPDVTMLSNLGIGWDQATRADEMQQVLIHSPLANSYVHVLITFSFLRIGWSQGRHRVWIQSLQWQSGAKDQE